MKKCILALSLLLSSVQPQLVLVIFSQNIGTSLISWGQEVGCVTQEIARGAGYLANDIFQPGSATSFFLLP